VLIVRSPVRISFGGGGTDLPSYYEQFGGAVLSTTINKYFYSFLGTRSDGRVQVISSDLRVFENWQDIATMSVQGSELEIPLAVLKGLGSRVSVDLFLASEIPPGTGLGSSASVCVNISHAFANYLHQPMSKYELAERAFHIARNILGKHVGKQDEYAASFGGLNYICFNPDGTTKVEAMDLDNAVAQEFQSSLMLFFTGSAHHSWTVLREQEDSTRAQTGSTLEALHEVKGLGGRMRDALQHARLQSFGELLHEEWEAKKRISKKISTARIDRLYSLARENGARGGKITGAGGGGFLLLYCEKPYQEAVRQALSQEGVHEMAFAFDTQGAQVIVDDPFIDRDAKGGSRWTFVPVAPRAVASNK
jgi:D-glycero-alpha-D-manno-heptose-7-phosphate kinase